MLVGSATTPVRLRSYANSLNCAQTLKAKSLHRAQTQYLSAGRYRSGWTPAQLPHTKIIAGPAATGLTAPMLIGSMSCREPAAGLAASWPWRKPRMTQTAQFNHGNRCSPARSLREAEVVRRVRAWGGCIVRRCFVRFSFALADLFGMRHPISFSCALAMRSMGI